MGTLCGFAPWLVYWVLLGNVPLTVAALVALAVAVVSLAVGRVDGSSGSALEIGSAGTFSLLTVASLALDPSVVGPWTVAVSFVGILGVAVFCGLSGKPFVREFAPVGSPTDVTRSEGFGPMGTRATWIWVGAAAGMVVSASIPPIVRDDAQLPDSHGGLGAVFFWAVPLVLFCTAAVASRTLHDRAIAAASDPGVVRRTSFVAFRELAIDELYYLAREKVEREVGAGMEAYDVSLGSGGTPLTGDESRESWPATYKVRERR